jgi:predicted esterase
MILVMIKSAVIAVLVLAAQAAAPSAPAPAVAPAPGPRAVVLLGHSIAFFPASVPPSTRTAPPVLILLHGARGEPRDMIKRFAFEAEARGIVLLAPSSLGATWDVIRLAQRTRGRESSGKLDGPYVFRGSRDATRVEAAIAELGKHVPLNRRRMVLAGFSDGATFALAHGLSRGHEFGSVIAFSPGLAIPVARPAAGRPVLVSHGRQDPVLPYAQTCGTVLPLLRTQKAAVAFRPFDGRHQIPADVITEFLDRAFGPRPGTAARPIAADRSECTRSYLPPAEIPRA